MKKDFKKAIEIADKLEYDITKINPSLSYLSITKLAEFTAMTIRQEIPMYNGNLNPKWKIYDDVVAIIKGRQNGRA